MRKRAILAAVLAAATLPAVAATAHAATPALPKSVQRTIREHPGGVLRVQRMVYSRHHKRGQLSTYNTVWGNCGQSYLYTIPATGIGHGWMQESFGLSLDYPIVSASAVVSWSNISTGGHNAYDQAWGWNINGNEHTYRNAYVGVGWVYAVMYASALIITPGGWATCHTPYGQPYSTIYVYHAQLKGQSIR